MRRVGITACGAYVPRLRLSRSVIAASTSWLRSAAPARVSGERSFCNWDEDAVTMAVEAARLCLGARDTAAISSVVLASTTPPFADRSNAGLVAGALDVSPRAAVADAGGSQRAGTSALLHALRSGAADDETLVVASDRRLAKPGSAQELTYGHGAAAALVGSDDLIAEFVGGATLHSDLVDHYRASGANFDYTLEERWVRDEGHMKLLPEALSAALESAGVQPGTIARAILPVPQRTAQSVARLLKLPPDCLAPDPADSCGDIGVGHPLLRLALALEAATAGDMILLAGFGQGIDAIVLRATGAASDGDLSRSTSRMLGERIEETQYTRFLSHCGLLEMEFGMRAERDNRTAQTASFRRQRDLLAFVGGRCSACGTVQFPKTHACVNPECRAFETQVDHPLAASTGRVKTFTEDWLAYCARPPLVYGNVALEGGGNAFIEFADTMPGELAVGSEVRFVFRIKDVDRLRRFHRYFWKATPVRS
ncbi:MAG TPA: zinc ribbon domain-containing protein [Steroidobacteraceae bacterium]|nr:zinc ribbon domain-containing protein [Steroidobacteraceae bacterium]